MRLKNKAGEERGFGLTLAQWQVIRKAAVVWKTAFATEDWSLTVTGHDLPEDVAAEYITSNGFNFFGVPPSLGRGLVPSGCDRWGRIRSR